MLVLCQQERATADRDSINLDLPSEVRWWCQRFGCTRLELGQAVRDVGPDPNSVEAHLRGAAVHGSLPAMTKT